MKIYGSTAAQSTLFIIIIAISYNNIKDASRDNTKEKGPDVDKQRPQE
jgi:hypothetical protein